MPNMNFENQTLDAVFKTSHNLAIPTYQRGYAWSQEQWEDFWEDLNEVMEDKEQSHFLGQVVTNTLDGKEYIVDGQQRITTAVIFLAVLRDQFMKLDSPTAEVRASDIQSEFIGTPGHYHLTQAEKSLVFFQKLIQEPGKFKTVQADAKTSTDRNFVKAYLYLTDKVSEQLHEKKIEEERLNLLQTIKRVVLDHMFVMKISTNDEASTFVIFETLNARGRELNSSDLLKNHLFRKASGAKEIRQYWDNMMEPLEYDSARATRFIRAYWNGTQGFVTEKKLYRELNHGIQTRNDAVNFVEKLSSLAYDFAAIDDTKSESIYQDERLTNNLKILNLLGAKTFYPLMLIMADKEFSEDDMVKVTYKVISFTVRNFTIGNLVANQYEKMFSEIARSLYRGEINTVGEVNARIAANMIEDDRFRNAVKFASVKTEKAAKYILSELAYDGDENKIDLDDVKVIKIDENVENSDRIGNKIMITKLEAKEAKKSKAAKLRVVQNAKFENTRKMAGFLGNMSSEEIDDRQAEWINTAVDIWIK